MYGDASVHATLLAVWIPRPVSHDPRVYEHGTPIHIPVDDAGRAFHYKGIAWTMESKDPLTLSPSISVPSIGIHGWIKNGKWSDA